MRIKVWTVDGRQFISDEKKNVSISKDTYEAILASIRIPRNAEPFSIVQEGVRIFLNPDNIIAIGLIDPPRFDG